MVLSTASRPSADSMVSGAIHPAALPSDQDTRPGLAIVVNVMAPYRLNLHELIAAGIPELKLHTLITHGPAEFEWTMKLPEAIHAKFFGTPDDSPLAGTFRRPFSEWRKGARLIEYIKTNNIRAVILFGYRYISFLRVIRYCRRAGIPVFVHNDSNVHGDRNLSNVKRAGKNLLYRWWLKQVSGVMSMGEYGDQFFLRYGANPRLLYRVPWAVDRQFYSNLDEEKLRRFCRKFHLSAGRRYILYSGRLVPVKRVDLLIDAFAAIAPQRPDWDLLIVGHGVLGDELRRRVPERIRSRVVWTGFLDGEDPALAYGAADVLVLPSDREPWALVVQEAMAAGLAVVASDVVASAHEIVEDGYSGRIFPAGNQTELEKAILQVTATEAIEMFKQRSRAAVVAWQEKVDPVAEIRRALANVLVLNQ